LVHENYDSDDISIYQHSRFVKDFGLVGFDTKDYSFYPSAFYDGNN